MPACASGGCWPGTGDNGEGDEAIGLDSGRAAALILWLCRRLDWTGRDRTGLDNERLRGWQGQTGGLVAMEPEEFCSIRGLAAQQCRWLQIADGRRERGRAS